MESDTDGPLHSVAILGLAYPDCLRAVCVVLDLPVARDVACLSMVMECIPLHSTADPCSRHTDIGRLHDSVAVEDVIAVGLVDSIEQTTADLRKDTELHVLVLHVETVVGDILAFACHVVVERIRIDAPLGSLV